MCIKRKRTTSGFFGASYASKEFQDEIDNDPAFAMYTLRCTVTPFVRFGAAMWCTISVYFKCLSLILQ